MQSLQFVYMFPGQGSQKVGMAASFASSSRAAAHIIERADERLGWPLSRLMFRGGLAELSQTANLQVALCVAEAACLAAAKEACIPGPVAVIGHSLGELTACYAAGAYSFETLVDLAVTRGKLMATCACRSPGSMLALSTNNLAAVEQITVAAAVHGIVMIGSRNAPHEVVLTGTWPALLVAESEARIRGIRAELLRVSGPWHSPAMAEAAHLFSDFLRQCPVFDPAICVCSCIDGSRMVERETLCKSLGRQIEAPLRWDLVMREIVHTWPGAILVEVGPGKVLAGLALKNDRSSRVLRIEDPGTLHSGLDAIRGFSRSPLWPGSANE